MRAHLRTAILAAGAVVLSAARPAAAGNPLTVVVANGPYAGTYQAKADEVICLHAKADKSFAASFKDFAANSPRAFSEGGLRISNVDAPGPKMGDLHVAFGTKDKNSIEYDVTGVPITMTTKGKGADVAGAGKTKTGVSIKVSASCTDIDKM